MSDPDSRPSIGRGMTAAAVLLSVSILLSRVLGFAREAVIAYSHGASQATDAYYAAFTLPDLMNYFLAGGTLSITFIPLFAAHLAKGDEEGGWRLFSTVATTMGLVLVVATVVFELAAPALVPLIVPGFDDPVQIELAVRMTRIVIPAQLCFYVGGLLQATLLARTVFWPSAVSPLIYNVCIIAGGILLEPWLGIEGFSVGVLAGAFLGPLAVPLWAARKEVHFRPRIAPRDPDFIKFALVTIPLMVGVGLVTLDEWLLRYFGSAHAAGAITWLNNSRKLMLVLFAVIGQAAGQAALPFLTRLFHEGREEEMGDMLARSLGAVLFLAALGAAGLMASAEPAVFLVFQRGQFTPQDAAQTATLLMAFSTGLLAWSVQTLAARGFYARQDTFTPMVVSTVVVLIALPIYWALDRAMGVVGLALATSIGMTINAVATVGTYKLRGGALPLGPLGAGLAKGLGAGAAAGGAAWGALWLVSQWTDPRTMPGGLIALACQAVAFVAVVAVIALVFRPPELDTAVNKVGRLVARIRRR